MNEFGMVVTYCMSLKQCEVTDQTREAVFHHDIQTQRGKLKIRRAAECF